MELKELFETETNTVKRLLNEQLNNEAALELILETFFKRIQEIEQTNAEVLEELTNPGKLKKWAHLTRGITWDRHYSKPKEELNIRVIGVVAAFAPVIKLSNAIENKSRLYKKLEATLFRQVLPILTAYKYNTEAEATFGKSMHELLESAKAGDTDALGNAVIIDPSLLYSELVRERFMFALVSGDRDTVVSLCNKVVNEHKKAFDRKHSYLRLAINLMHRFGCLDTFTPAMGVRIFVHKLALYDADEQPEEKVRIFISREKKKYQTKTN